MKSLLLALSLFITACSVAQKQRLEGDNSEFLCKNDSINAQVLLELKKQKIDTSIEILYDFDNGRIEHSKRIIIWKQDGLAFVRLIIGCSDIYIDTSYTVNLNEVINYISSTKINNIFVPVQSDNGTSHDTGYLIEIKFPLKNIFFKVRDNALRRANVDNDSRIVLTKMLIETIH